MNPLLHPTTHAEMEIIARNLSQSGLFGLGDPAQFYTKLLFGAVLSLSVTESLHGVCIEDSKLIVEVAMLERVIKRTEGYEVKVVSCTDELCDLNFFAGGKICGQAITKRAEVKHDRTSPQLLYQLALAKGARTYFSKLFGHKFFIREEVMPAADHSLGKQPVNVATLPATSRPNHTKKEQALNSQALLDWQNKVDTLSAEFPEEWDQHAKALQTLTFLPEIELKGLWKKFKLAAERVGVGYNPEVYKFFLVEWQAQ